jgi:hypothetical protein
MMQIPTFWPFRYYEFHWFAREIMKPSWSDLCR